MVEMTQEQVRRLRQYVNERVSALGCDHSLRHARDWARREGLTWEDVLDVLEANGGYCDCETTANVPDRPEPAPRRADTDARSADWKLPPDWVTPEGVVYTKVIVCRADVGRNTHAREGELLVPPPAGTKARKQVRASVHYFVGCTSGLPSEVGVVATVDPISAEVFAHRVRSSGPEELRQFTSREAAFVLSRIAALDPGIPVGTHFMEVSGVVGKRDELRVHKVILRK